MNVQYKRMLRSLAPAMPYPDQLDMVVIRVLMMCGWISLVSLAQAWPPSKKDGAGMHVG